MIAKIPFCYGNDIGEFLYLDLHSVSVCDDHLNALTVQGRMYDFPPAIYEVVKNAWLSLKRGSQVEASKILAELDELTFEEIHGDDA